jgi:archaellum biogenesis ATPase FlaH
VIKAEVMDLTAACPSFPELPVPEIRRDYILDDIDDLFRDTELIIIEGEEGIGKTILLAQFAKRHSDHAISLFIRPTRSIYNDLEYLRYNLCNQLEWALYRRELEEEKSNDRLLRFRLIKLQKLVRQGTFFFVIDGLSEIPEKDKQARDLILEMVPLGRTGFRFLLSGDRNDLVRSIPSGIQTRSSLLPRFDLNQTRNYLDDLVAEQQLVQEIYATCRGIPANLYSIRRILQSGTSPQTLLDEMSKRVPELFEIEWHGVKTDDTEQHLLLAILAHDPKVYSIESLASLLNLDVAAVGKHFEDLSFLVVNPDNREVKFVSEPFRRYAAEQLRHLKGNVYELRINNLFENPDSEEALADLPGYLEQTGKLEILVDYLSPDRFIRMLESDQSLDPIRQKTTLGVNAARELHRDGDLIRFSMQNSILLKLYGADVWRSEVEARMALDDYDSALALSESTILKEDQLHLLAIVAKARYKKGVQPESELIERIRQLFDQIDKASLGERAFEIASDLIYSEPSLAIELVEKATHTDEGEHALDWAFAKLCANAALDVKHEGGLSTDTLEAIRSRIGIPEARDLSTAASFLIGDHSASEAIKEVEMLESTTDRLFLLRLWAMENRERDDAFEVVDYALKLIKRTMPYAPNARDYRQIATPLPFITDKSKAKQFVSSFDSQKGNIQYLGPSEDYVRLQLLLAQTESRYDFDAAYDRIVEVYIYISTLADLATKAACLARLFAALANIEDSQNRLAETETHSVVQNDLELSIELLLNNTGDHFLVSRGIIAALAKIKPDMALNLALRLNVEIRRDAALFDLIKSSIRLPKSKLNPAFTERAIREFTNTDLRDKAILEVTARLSAISDTEKDPKLTAKTLPIIDRVKDIRSASERCDACCLAYKFLTEQEPEEYSSLADHLLKILRDAWEAIDVGWHRIDVGFRIVRSLAECDPETARMYLDLTEKYRNGIILDANTTALTYLACLRLSIRAYSGLLCRNIDTPEDLDLLTRLIDHVPSSGERAGLWAELALRCFINGRPDRCDQIVAQHLKPLIQDLPNDDRGYKDSIIVSVVPALYCAHERTAIQQISELPQPMQNKAYTRICEFILRKQPLSDPYEYLAGQGYSVTYEELLDICDLLDQITQDALVYYFIERISDTVSSSRRRRDFTREQQSDIANRLEEISNKLPDQQNIRHDGYKIISLAQVARIRRPGTQEWASLLDRARKIPNLSDKAFVLSRQYVKFCVNSWDRPLGLALRFF